MAVGDQFRLHGAERARTTRTRWTRRRGRRRRRADAATWEPLPGRRTTRAASGGRPLGRRAVRPDPGRDRGPAGPAEPAPAPPPKAPARGRRSAARPVARRRAARRPEAAPRRGPRPRPGPDDELIARRDEAPGARHGAARPHHQARPGRRPEPAARPSAQRAVGDGRRAARVPRTSTWPRSPPAARSHLAEAFAAGAAFGGAGGGDRRRGRRGRAVGGGDWRTSIVTMLRRQMADGDDELGRPGRVPRSANGGANGWSGWPVTHATQAFSAGVAAAAGGRQGALGGDVRERLLGLRGQCARRRDARRPRRSRPATPIHRRTRAAGVSWHLRTTDLGLCLFETRRAWP